ncbi:IclR family transcriptional regulator [Rhodococcus sp. NPDC047139]|uniref:IclR family transcriptional regulator n=1 Tax=Rhodococcus sp. NPDC047139 TaxID=3155141 RepID=UPI0033D57B31
MATRNAVDTQKRPEKASRTSGSGSESHRRRLGVLLGFTEEFHTQTVQEIAARVDIPVSSAYRYVSQLREVGLLEEAEFGGYRVSLRAVELARAARAGSAGIVEVTRPVLERLTREYGETSLLIRRLGHAVVAVDMEETRSSVRLAFERGRLMPLHQGAAARVLLAAMKPKERAEYYASIYSFSANPDLPGDAELTEIGEQGWAESFGQIEEGIWGCAAVIKARRQVVAALSMAGPIYRLDATRREQVKTAVKDAADEINAHLAGIEF